MQVRDVMTPHIETIGPEALSATPPSACVHWTWGHYRCNRKGRVSGP